MSLGEGFGSGSEIEGEGDEDDYMCGSMGSVCVCLISYLSCSSICSFVPWHLPPPFEILDVALVSGACPIAPVDLG